MKRTIFLGVALSAAFLSGRLYAQDSKSQAGLTFTQALEANATAAPSADAPGYHPAAVNSISGRAIRDFKWRYAKVEDGHWTRLEKGACVVFSKDSARTRVFYDLKGHWQASVTYCDDKKLPFFVRDMVRRAYYDLPITCVEIIDVADRTVYLVHVEDKNVCKLIRVDQEGEMDVFKEFWKTN
jgi:hypothetical protein